VEGVKYTTARRVAEHAIDAVFAGLGWNSPQCRTSETPLELGPEPDVLNAVREEMAITLSDIVFRRTSLGALPGPDRSVVVRAAEIAGAELGWDTTRQNAEIDSVMQQHALYGRPAAEVIG
jgi:glycerol-3-phosphate dehydrogenase